MSKIGFSVRYDASMPADWVIQRIADAQTRVWESQIEIDDMEAERRINAMYPTPTLIAGFWGGLSLAMAFAVLMVILIALGSN